MMADALYAAAVLLAVAGILQVNRTPIAPVVWFAACFLVAAAILGGA